MRFFAAPLVLILLDAVYVDLALRCPRHGSIEMNGMVTSAVSRNG